MVAPARAETAAILPVLLINSRREVRLVGLWFIGYIFSTQTSGCQFEKSTPPAQPRADWIVPPSWKPPAPSPCEARAGRGLGRGAPSIELARLIGIPSPVPSPHSLSLGEGIDQRHGGGVHDAPRATARSSAPPPS